MNNYHDFTKDLEFSKSLELEPFWNEIYKQAFPDMIEVKYCNRINFGQNKGIDKTIYLKSGDQILIDEKIRRTEYNDICLEYEHIGEKYHKKGWIEKDLFIDYLAYAFLNSKTCYLFPWIQLKKAWTDNKDKWFNSSYKISRSENRNYTTYGLCVPTSTLLNLIPDTIIIKIGEKKKENKKPDLYIPKKKKIFFT